VVHAGADELPFPDASFDAATAINALQFAADTTDALQEMSRVVRRGGLIAIANWAEGARNDIDVIERAVAEAREEELGDDGPLRPAGGLESALGAAGLDVIATGVVAVSWEAVDDETLVRGILLGEDDATMAELAPAVVTAAAGFRDGRGGFVLRNAFRWAIARV
jgi:SAM-dependent methyltransferase